MAGRFMDKETIESEAKRLGVDLTGLKWPEKQQAIMNAQSKEKEGNVLTEEDVPEISRRILGDEIVSKIVEESAGEEVLVHVEDDDPMSDLRGKKVLICPEMAPTSRQLFGYEEELDEEITVEEVVHDVDAAYKASKDMVTGTYKVTGKTGKKVVAQTALPKEGCGITFRPDKDIVPVATFKGRSGYLWTHHRLPNIKGLLIESGYYEEYKDRFKDEPAIWHSGGKILACDISLVHSIFQQIEDKERDKRIQREQNSAFIRNQMER